MVVPLHLQREVQRPVRTKPGGRDPGQPARHQRQPGERTDDSIHQTSQDSTPLTATQQDHSSDDADSNAPSNTDQDNHSTTDTTESWTDWIKRATRNAEHYLQKYNIMEWTTHYRSRRWQWAREVATHSPDRWTNQILMWQPLLHSKRYVGRRQARPKRRWDDDLQQYVHQQLGQNCGVWHAIAADKAQWANLRHAYVQDNWGQIAKESATPS